MRRSIGFHSIGVALLCAAAPAWAGSQPNTQVSLHPSVTSIRPGSTFDVAIRFELTDDWHLYWKNPGDSGLAPRVEWDLPPGFSLGALRFPAPQRHTGVGNLVTHILEGSPCLIQTITAPEELPPEAEVVLTAKLNWLACKTACVREQRAVSLRLAIGDTDLTPNPQHLAVLERAHRSLPIAPDASKRFKLTVVPPTGPLRPGQSSEVMLDMSIGRGSHVQSNQPSIAAFIPTHAFVERSDALDIGKAEYPPAREHVHPQLGKMSEYRGDVRIRIPFQVREEAAGDQATLAGVLTAQACDDRTGTCYPPEHVAWAVHLPLVETATVASATPNQEPSVGGAREGSPPPSEAPPPGEPEPSAAAEKASGDSVQSFLERLGLPGLLVGCFLYGLFINATPCVLPLLSIKVLGFVQQAHESRTRTLLLGLSFGGGVILFFIVLGFLASRG
ncbi:MAG: hypothetical protein GY842_24240, partial [bacterium]|nr:hypothetical protein [bacterium]